MRLACLFSIALGLGIFNQGVRAQPPESANAPKSGKPAWQWSLDERLAARFDPTAMKARQARRLAEQKSDEAARRALGIPEDPLFDGFEPSTYSVEGKDDPELFLPSELFRHLLATCFPPEGNSSSRRRIEQRAAALGFGSDLWSRLGKVAEPLLAYDRERHKLAMDTLRSGAEVLEPEDRYLRCYLQADALSAAKMEFGEEAFFRLLYETVAPSLSISDSPNQSAAELAKDLRYLEEGCR